jgi:hypothetical protein
VKERIIAYLRDAGHGVATDQILSEVLNIHSPNAHSANKVLAGILADDPRFIFTEGLWNLNSISKEPVPFDFGQAVILHLQSANRFDDPKNIRGAIRLADGRFREFFAPASIDLLGKLRSEIEGHLLIMWSSRELQLWNRLLRSQALETWRGEKLYLRNLAARALKLTESRLQLEDLAAELALSPQDEERPREAARYISACWLLLLDRVPSEFRRDPATLRDWIDGLRKKTDFSRFAFGPTFLRQLPDTPGSYFMKNRAGTILYVGKSRNLRRRVSSYFTPHALSDPKVARIHEQLHSIDVCTTENEIEAMLLEMRMIKDFHPPINLQTEIHEHQAGYRSQGHNLLLFVLDAEKAGAQVYFLRDGIFVGRNSAPLGHPPSKRLCAKVKSVFFAQRRSRKPQGETWEKDIIFRWFTANRKRLNYLDVDQASGFDAVIERLRDYLCDPDRLIQKVYYR